MWNDNKSLVVTANNKDGQTLKLKYKILDTDLSNRWLDIIEQNIKANNTLVDNYQKILSQDECLEKFAEFYNNITTINSMYDRKLKDIVSLEFLSANQNLLNDLHEEYEIYGDRLQQLLNIDYFKNPEDHLELCNNIWPGRQQNIDLHNRFLKLNDQIHEFEAIFRAQKKSTNGVCLCLIDYVPAGITQELKIEDYFLFESDFKWGWLYLGYNTLGKHWVSTMQDDDIEVVHRDQVRPQSRFSAEFFLNFKLTVNPTRVNFYNWWIENNMSAIKNPNMTLKELALGFIPLGKLVGYRINNDVAQEIPDAALYPDIINWNTNVWSKFNKITNVEIFNT